MPEEYRSSLLIASGEAPRFRLIRILLCFLISRRNRESKDRWKNYARSILMNRDLNRKRLSFTRRFATDSLLLRKRIRNESISLTHRDQLMRCIRMLLPRWRVFCDRMLIANY